MSPRRRAALGLSLLGAIAAFLGLMIELSGLATVLLVVFAALGIWLGYATGRTLPAWLVAVLPGAGAALVFAGLAREDWSGPSSGHPYDPLAVAGSLTLMLALVVAGATVGAAQRDGGVSALRTELATSTSDTGELPPGWSIAILAVLSLAPIAGVYAFFGTEFAWGVEPAAALPPLAGALIGYATRFRISLSLLIWLGVAGAVMFLLGMADYNDDGPHGSLLILALYGFLLLVATSVAAGISAGGLLRRAREQN